MKKYEFEIAPSVVGKFFPNNRVKTKTQILNILLESVRYALSYSSLNINNSKGKIVLVVDKMSRLFFCSENKAYSIAFPFLTLKYNNQILFSLQNTDVDAYLVSNLITVINDDKFLEGCSIELSESLLDYEAENVSFWNVLRELLLYEDGYIRYDYDEKGFIDARNKGEEHRHPLNHFDLFYTNRATFKVGAENKIDLNDLIDILDIRTDCKYLKNW